MDLPRCLDGRNKKHTLNIREETSWKSGRLYESNTSLLYIILKRNEDYIQ